MNQYTPHDAPTSTPNLYGAPVFDSDGRVSDFILERGNVRYLDKALTDAIAAGAVLARFHDDARGTVYLADLQLFRTKGIRVDFGHGVQWVLPVKHWTQPGQDSEPTHSEPEAEQMGLFGGAL